MSYRAVKQEPYFVEFLQEPYFQNSWSSLSDAHEVTDQADHPQQAPHEGGCAAHGTSGRGCHHPPSYFRKPRKSIGHSAQKKARTLPKLFEHATRVPDAEPRCWPAHEAHAPDPHTTIYSAELTDQRFNAIRCEAKPPICSSCFDVQHAPSRFSMHHLGAGWRAHEPQRNERQKQSANQQAGTSGTTHQADAQDDNPAATANDAQERQHPTKTRTDVLEAILAQQVANVAAGLGSAVEKPADGRRDRNVARLGTSDGRRVSRMPGRGWAAGGNSQEDQEQKVASVETEWAVPHKTAAGTE